MSDEAPQKKTRGPSKPVQGKFEIEFLKEAKAPERAPLGGPKGPRDTVLSDILKKLAERPGTLAVVFTSPDADEVYHRRASLIQAATRLGIKLDMENTASRAFVKDGAAVVSGDKQLHALYAMVAA